MKPSLCFLCVIVERVNKVGCLKSISDKRKIKHFNRIWGKVKQETIFLSTEKKCEKEKERRQSILDHRDDNKRPKANSSTASGGL